MEVDWMLDAGLVLLDAGLLLLEGCCWMLALLVEPDCWMLEAGLVLLGAGNWNWMLELCWNDYLNEISLLEITTTLMLTHKFVFLWPSLFKFRSLLPLFNSHELAVLVQILYFYYNHLNLFNYIFTLMLTVQYGSKMSSKKLKTISINRHGKQTVRPPTHYGHCATSLTTQSGHTNNRFPTSAFPNDLLPTKQNHYEDDDIDYDANDSEDDDSDDGGMGCDQQNDLAIDDELGHEAQLDITDAFGCRRKRGITRLGNIWNLPKGQRITVEFNKKFQIVGENSTVFPRFLGTMARKGDYCPLNYLTWPKVPNEYKKHCLTTIESKFILKYHNDDDMVRKCWTQYALSSLGRKWRDFRNELKDKFFDVSKTPEQMVAGIPSSVNPTQMKCLIEYWLSPEGLARSAKNKLSRSLQKDVHTLGGKTFAQLAHELEKKDGRAQTRSDLYIKSRKRKTGEAVTEIAEKNIEEIERLILQQDVDPSQGFHDQIVYGEGDIYSQVISKEERCGRIRGLGFRPLVGCTSGSSSKSTYSDLMEQHTNDTNTIKSLQEKILQHEKERAEEKKAMEEERKEIFARLRMIEQFIPRANFDHGPRDEASSGIQAKSSCASHHEGDNNEGN